MPNQDPVTIEQRLKAYAEDRRRQLDRSFEMPPGTRQCLRTELARRRQGSSAEPAGAQGWWKVFWPYVALGTSVLAAAVICGVVWWQDFRPASQRAYAAGKAKSEAGALPALDTDDSAAQTTNLARSADGTAEPVRLLSDEAETGGVEAPSRGLREQGQLALKDLKQEEGERLAVGGPAPSKPEAVLPPPAAQPMPKLAVPPVSGERFAPAPVDKAETAVKPLSGDAETSRNQRPAAATERKRDETARYGAGALTGASRGDQQSLAEPLAPQKAKGAVMSEAAGRSQIERRVGLGGQPPATAPAPQPAPAAVAPPAGAFMAAKPAESRVLETEASARKRVGMEAANQVRAVLPAQDLSNFSNQQRFVQDAARTYRRNFNSPPRTEILGSFRMEQAGNRLLVTDSDGSVYTGDLQPVEAVAGEEKVKPPVLGVPVQALGVQNSVANNNELPFTVSGTNQTLQQPVVFSGRLILTNAQAAGQFLQNQPTSGNQAMELFLNHSVVRGRASIGQRTRMEINASPAAP